MPQVSVIIPAYRPAGFAALRTSMDANSEVDAEWIVVDDGSGPAFDTIFSELDGTGAVVVRQGENRRQGAARNVGLARAQGDWIKFLDADDRLDQGHLAALLRAATRGAGRGSAISFAPTRHVFASGGMSDNDTWRGLPPEPMAQLARLLHQPFLTHCGALFPRTLLTGLGGYDESLVTDEDGDLLIRVLMAGAHFEPVEEVRYHYVHHHGLGRVSSDVGGDKLAARLRVCDRVQAAFAGPGQTIPPSVSRGLALRLDKIAMSYWNADRESAKAMLARARALCPGYRPAGRWPQRALRALGGPSAVISVARLYRRLRGRPTGGMQG